MRTVEIARITPQERLDLIGELWDSLEPEHVQLSPTQDAELDRRITRFEKGEEQTIAFEDILANWAHRA